MKGIVGLTLCVIMMACNKNEAIKNQSYSNVLDVVISHINLDLSIDFDKQQLAGWAKLSIKPQPNANKLILDTKDLNIAEVLVDEQQTAFELGANDPLFGTALIIPIHAQSQVVSIRYNTSPQAAAVQWLKPEQTHDKKTPFMFTQSQAILARSWIPLQDLPQIRFTYSARIQVSKPYIALMSAQGNATVANDSGIYHFKQPKPIPSYLMALAAGQLEFKALSNNSGVYAEPGMLASAAYELEPMPGMIDAASELYGTYPWNRYDVLVLPPSFPFGGMENPELTFATPTIIAGDRSLVSLIAHELAHSWSGNLVTNRTWDDFWLNEGFTVYFESRIMEKIYGKPYADMLTVNGYGELQHTLDDLLKEQPNDTKLKLNLGVRDPDDGLTDIAYEKGRFFLCHLEQLVGRDEWDSFLKNYFAKHAFSTMTTEEFVAYLNTNLLGKNSDWKQKAQVKEWIYQTGMPANFIAPISREFAALDDQLVQYQKTNNTASFKTKNYTTHQWLYVLRHLPQPTKKTLAQLDKAFNLSQQNNSEILCDWLRLCINSNYSQAYPKLRSFLTQVGRRKFLTPLYQALLQTPEGTKLANDIYRQARSNYHTVSRQTLDQLLKYKT